MTTRLNHKLFSCTLLAVAMLALFGSSLAYAVRGPAGVVYGLHNLSVTGADPRILDGDTFFYGEPGSSKYVTDEDQVCVFCHTPHGGTLTGPLWNRTNPNSTWSHYNSATMSSYLQGLNVARSVSDESLLCMSCHDGSISVNHVVNLPNDRGGAAIITTFNNDPDTEIVAGGGARIGASQSVIDGTGDLSDDHPISFSYASVYAEYEAGAKKQGQLHAVADAETAGVRFFGTDSRVECSSCHDPHVNYNPDFGGGDADYNPFLVTPNSGSAMCLACHNK